MGACKSLPAALGYSDSELTAPGFVGERVGVNSFIDGAEGTSAGPHKIHVVSWLPPTAPRAVVIICHGLHEHALRHYRMAHALTSRGVAVYGCDHFAHGRSDGERGLVADYRVLIEDFIKFATWAKSQHPGVPVSLFGHSMGAMISSICVNKIGDINSVIFSANPIHPGPGSSSPQGIKLLHSVATSRLGRSLADVLAAVDPKGPAGPIDIDGITGDLDEQAILLRDPHRYEGAIRNITARELLRMIDRAVKNYSQIKVPFFCMHGTADTIALVSGSRELYMGVSTPWAKRTFVIYPGLHHELFHESPVARAACIADAVRYYDETLMKHAAPVYSQDNDDVDVSVM